MKVKTMNQYYAIDNEEGLRFLTTDAYATLIKEHPEVTHRNLGDFYTDASLEELAQVSYDSISKDINVNTLDGQITIYIPEAHEEGKENEREFHYECLAVTVVDELGSEEKKGRFQEYIAGIHSQVNGMITDVKDMNEKLKSTTVKLEQAFRD